MNASTISFFSLGKTKPYFLTGGIYCVLLASHRSSFFLVFLLFVSFLRTWAIMGLQNILSFLTPSNVFTNYLILFFRVFLVFLKRIIIIICIKIIVKILQMLQGENSFNHRSNFQNIPILSRTLFCIFGKKELYFSNHVIYARGVEK